MEVVAQGIVVVEMFVSGIESKKDRLRKMLKKQEQKAELGRVYASVVLIEIVNKETLSSKLARRTLLPNLVHVKWPFRNDSVNVDLV